MNIKRDINTELYTLVAKQSHSYDEVKGFQSFARSHHITVTKTLEYCTRTDRQTYTHTHVS